MNWLYGYVTSCIFMGLGIGFDVMIATVGRFRHFRTIRSGYQWVARLSFTHVAFPMIGYYSFAALERAFPDYRVLLGLVASSLIVWFLWHMVKEWTNGNDDECSCRNIQAASWLAVLAVSWDALWSGPAKSAQAMYWSAGEVVVSFFIAGVTVTAMALIALSISVHLNKRGRGRNLGNVENLVRWEFLGLAAEFSVLGYFGILAFDRYVLSLPDETNGFINLQDLLLSIVLTILVFSFLRSRIARSIRNGIEEELGYKSAENDVVTGM